MANSLWRRHAKERHSSYFITEQVICSIVPLNVPINNSNRHHAHKVSEHAYKQTTSYRIFYVINPEGFLLLLLLSEIKPTNVWNWSQCLKPTHTHAHTHTHTHTDRVHPHTKWLCVMDRITSYSHPHPDRWAGTELWESQLCEGHVAQHRKIYQYRHTGTHLGMSTHIHHNTNMWACSRHTLVVTQRELCTSPHHKVSHKPAAPASCLLPHTAF